LQTTGEHQPEFWIQATDHLNTSAVKDDHNAASDDTKPPKLQRDEWMTMAPTADGLASRMDPTKQRPRGFNTGKGAKSSASAGATDNSTWHETAEQKQKRLQDEMMGISRPKASITPSVRPDDKQKDRELRDKLVSNTL
jgi:hypothetical protein